MDLLLNANIAYVFVVVGITAFFLWLLKPSSKTYKYGSIVLITIAWVYCFFFKLDLVALGAVILSPILFAIAVKQERLSNPLYIIAIFTLSLGAFLMFNGPKGELLVTNKIAFVSIICASVVWLTLEGRRNVEGVKTSSVDTGVVGMIGIATSDIEPHSAGSITVEGETWPARSKELIHKGSAVRVLRQDGFFLTVKLAERVTKEDDDPKS